MIVPVDNNAYVRVHTAVCGCVWVCVRMCVYECVRVCVLVNDWSLPCHIICGESRVIPRPARRSFRETA